LSEPLEALAEYVLAMADDELILSHRDSEWTGHAPILEEDIAFTNIALDEMGHAAVWYTIRAELLGAEPEAYSDRLVFQRSAEDYRCTPLVELPNGDWAFSMLRQYLFDIGEKVRLEGLLSSGHTPIAHAAAKLRPEEAYHERHTRAWVLRLGQGTPESRGRMQAALDGLWSFAPGLFALDPSAEPASQVGLVPDAGRLRQRWEDEVKMTLNEAGLTIPEGVAPVTDGRRKHTEHLAGLLTELQSVARADPIAAW
jgi:ring-1,2-phenylacetyl-CoA epoxidase subunit PaaC